jgi:hypothetical protein
VHGAQESTNGSGALDLAVEPDGTSPATWLARSLAGLEGPTVTVHGHGDEVLITPGPGVRAGPRDLPLASRSVGSVALDMCLPGLADLDGLFGEVRRVLRPAGCVAALVPCRPPVTDRSWRALHRALGHHLRPRNRSATDELHWLIAAADFAVLFDQHRTFRLPLPDAEAAARAVEALTRGGVWPPDLHAEQLDAARTALARRAGPGRSLPVRLRLLVARR